MPSSKDIADLILKDYETANREYDLSWKRINGEDWARILVKFPQLAGKCRWGEVTNLDWVEILHERPEFVELCTARKNDGNRKCGNSSTNVTGPGFWRRSPNWRNSSRRNPDRAASRLPAMARLARSPAHVLRHRPAGRRGAGRRLPQTGGEWHSPHNPRKLKHPGQGQCGRQPFTSPPARGSRFRPHRHIGGKILSAPNLPRTAKSGGCERKAGHLGRRTNPCVFSVPLDLRFLHASRGNKMFFIFT